MNLVAPSTSSPASSPAVSTAGGPVLDPATARGATEVAIPPDAADGAAPFGQALSRRIDAVSRGANDLHETRGVDPRVRAGQDAAEPAAASASASAAAATSGKATDKIAAAAADADNAHALRVDDDPAPDALAQDLSAQLALVAQWAGATPPAAAVTGSAVRASTTVATVATAATGAARGAGKQLDLPGKPDMDSDNPLADVASTAAASAGGTSGTQARATGFSEVAAAIDAIAGKPGAAAASPDTANLLLAPNPAAAATHEAALVTAAATPPTTVPDRLHEQVGTPAWSHEVGQAALRIAANDLQTASLRLNPDHLGPLDVQVRINDGVAHIAFQAAHADTRQALEASRTTLEQLFQGQGLKTGDVSVGSQAGGAFDTRFGAARGDSGAATGGGRGRGGDGDGTDVDGVLAVSATVRLVGALGLVDTFA